MSPVLALSRHPDRVGECPLSGVKRTSKFKSVTSAFDPKRTFLDYTGLFKNGDSAWDCACRPFWLKIWVGSEVRKGFVHKRR
jgi:hypothetical protein